MKTIKLFLVLAATVAVFRMASAESIIQENEPWCLFQLSIVPDAVAFAPSDFPVLGINYEPFAGMQKRVGILNLQPLYGKSEVSMGVGYQGLGFNEEMDGFQLGIATFHRYFIGVNVAAVTGARENHGLQIGLVNFSGELAPQVGEEDKPLPAARGVQIGLVNYTTNGFQFGLLNYNAESAFPYMVFFNYAPAH